MQINYSAKIKHWLYIIGLMIAGESIYLLPYLRKTFQTSMEVVFGISTMQVGWLNTIFGIVAVICYFPSGWLADRISARRLLTFSLLTTSAGGFFMFSIPSYPQLLGLHAFWGITSILTFWAALIKATRNWGNPKNQGISFGLLDGGRGVLAALLSSLGTAAYAISDNIEESLQSVLVIYSVAPLVAGILIWFVIPEKQYVSSGNSTKKLRAANKVAVKKALQLKQIWLLALIVFCAYMLHVGSYDFPAFAERGYGQSKTFGAVLGTIRDWMRPVAAISAGLIADRFRSSKTVGASFLLLFFSFLSLSVIKPASDYLWLLWIQVILSALAIFSLRGVYFAILEETKVPLSLTGTAVGIVSFIGFSPDIFSHALSGWFVQNFQQNGFRYYFAILAVVAVVGFAASIRIKKFNPKSAMK